MATNQATPWPSTQFGGAYPDAFENPKTANYTISQLENGTLYTNLNATGAIQFKLPPITPFLYFRFRALAAQNMSIASNETTNMVVIGSTTGSTVAIQTPGQIVGAGLLIYSSGDGLRWYVAQEGSGPFALSNT